MSAELFELAEKLVELSHQTHPQFLWTEPFIELPSKVEAAFADYGYAGTSLRRIVARAHVTQALVTYYFGTKDALFKEFFLSRGRQVITIPIGDMLIAFGVD